MPLLRCLGRKILRMGLDGCENSEELVQRFVETDDLVARDELIAQALPIIEKVVRKMFSDIPREIEDAVQETVVKLCDKGKLRQWYERQPRPPFCAWVAVVAGHTTVDLFRARFKSKQPLPADIGLSRESLPDAAALQQELAAQFRAKLLESLLFFPTHYLLVFFMNFSYLDATSEEIAASVGVSRRTVFYRCREILDRIAPTCKEFLHADLERCPFEGTRHPLPGFENLTKEEQEKVNQRIHDFLRTYPLEQGTAFYMKYSVLALKEEEIARLLKQPVTRIHQYLNSLEEQIRRMFASGDSE